VKKRNRRTIKETAKFKRMRRETGLNRRGAGNTEAQKNTEVEHTYCLKVANRHQ
jgi:hypothetical protein